MHIGTIYFSTYASLIQLNVTIDNDDSYSANGSANDSANGSANDVDDDDSDSLTIDTEVS